MPDYLSRSERRLLARFAEILAQRAPEQVRALRVFGSRARGDSHEGSDLDVALEPSPGVPLTPLRVAAVDAAWDAMEELDLHAIMLSPTVVPMDGLGLAGVIEKEGLLIWASEVPA